MKTPLVACFPLVLWLACGCHQGKPEGEHPGGTYRFLKEIPIGGPGGWDYLSVSAQGRRLYVSHGTNVIVVDLTKDAVVGVVTNTPGVHGFAVARELGLGFASNGRSNTVSIVDLEELRTVARVPTGGNPDAILYEPAQEEVYAFNGRSNSVTVIEARMGKVVTTLPLPGKPEFAVADPAAGRVYVNIEDKNEVAALDTRTHKVVGLWPISPGEAASGLALDARHHRLFLGCENKLMVMMDCTSGKVLTTVPIGAGVDATAFDPVTRLAFSSNGEGTVTIAHQDTPDTLRVVQTLTTARGARTMALDPVTHKIYLSTAEFEPVPADAPGQRPLPKPDTFKVLVYGP